MLFYKNKTKMLKKYFFPLSAIIAMLPSNKEGRWHGGKTVNLDVKHLWLNPNSTNCLFCDLTSVIFGGGSVIKNLPAKKETWVPSLVQEDPLEKEMATRSNNLMDRGALVGYSPWGHKESDKT